MTSDAFQNPGAMNCVFGRLGTPCPLARLPPAAPGAAAKLLLRSQAPPSTPRLAAIPAFAPRQYPCNYFSATTRHRSDAYGGGSDKFAARARDLSQKALDAEEQEVRLRKHQIERPWHRDKADEPPVKAVGDARAAEPLSKGKLLTTPTRLLKLILPLPVSVEKDEMNNNKKSWDFGRSISSNDEIQPLALLIHPQQPLSYVERLIQAELPPVVEDGKEKTPNVYFRAEDTGGDKDAEEVPREAKAEGDAAVPDKRSPHVASYSGLGHEASARADEEKRWVRWSSSTEVGDFIRDAARGREFVIEVEGYGLEMRVGVPSFNDRTHYLRLRLRRMSRNIDRLAQIKHECDELAHRSAHRLAQGGFALLAGWWGVVYYVTFHTEAGWDLVEPVTYLAGLATIMGGYLWFLYISRDLSYKAAMNVTVSRRRTALYEARGFDVARWEQLVREANALRAEIKHIAQEYDVDWDEAADMGSEDVKDVLAAERHRLRRRAAAAEDDDTADDDRDRDGGDGGKAGKGKGRGDNEAKDAGAQDDKGHEAQQQQEQQAKQHERKGQEGD